MKPEFIAVECFFFFIMWQSILFIFLIFHVLFFLSAWLTLYFWPPLYFNLILFYIHILFLSSTATQKIIKFTEMRGLHGPWVVSPQCQNWPNWPNWPFYVGPGWSHCDARIDLIDRLDNLQRSPVDLSGCQNWPNWPNWQFSRCPG